MFENQLYFLTKTVVSAIILPWYMHTQNNITPPTFHNYIRNPVTNKVLLLQLIQFNSVEYILFHINNCTLFYTQNIDLYNSPHLLYDLCRSNLCYPFKNEAYLYYVMAQSVPHSKHTPPQLQEPIFNIVHGNICCLLNI